MATLEEMTAWSTEEIRTEVRKMLPPSWKMSVRPDNSGFWHVRLEDQEGKGVWATSDINEKRALFEVYGYLWLKQRPLRELDSPWVRRNPMLNPPQSSVSDSSPDPEDIDPEEVESVYSSVGK